MSLDFFYVLTYFNTFIKLNIYKYYYKHSFANVIAGVWSQPRHITVSSKIVELYWDEPEKNNGIVIQYRLFCNGEEIFKGGGENMNFTHSAMQPNNR